MSLNAPAGSTTDSPVHAEIKRQVSYYYCGSPAESPLEWRRALEGFYRSPSPGRTRRMSFRTAPEYCPPECLRGNVIEDNKRSPSNNSSTTATTHNLLSLRVDSARHSTTQSRSWRPGNTTNAHLFGYCTTRGAMVGLQGGLSDAEKLF